MIIDADLSLRLLTHLNKKTWITTNQLAREADVIRMTVIKSLAPGLMSILAYENDSWRIKKKAKPADITAYKEALSNGIAMDDDLVSSLMDSRRAIHKFKKLPMAHSGSQDTRKRQKIPGMLHSREGDADRINSTDTPGFSYGKRKYYKGPSGTYWNDPDFKRKEWS